MSQPVVTMNDGRAIPQLGFGVFKVPPAEATTIVGEAIKAGYRAIDTAESYKNEEGVGAAIAAAAVPRDELFITTKVWNDKHAPDKARAALVESLAKLQQKTVDLYLIHWPAPGQGDIVETWKTLIAMRDEGMTTSIGVSNFTIADLTRIIDATGVVPCVNQIELHPSFQQGPLRAFHAEHGILTESWSPLGRGAGLSDPVIGGIAQKHGRTPAQIILRWHLDLGLIVIPKTVAPARMAENFAVFDFTLDDADRAAIATVDRPDGRIGPDPATFSFFG
jgi:2,5-diketo-D-gluconate reductase A